MTVPPRTPPLSAQWAIGIYAGASPLHLAPAAANPVLSHLDVSDVPAAFVADPFMAHDGDLWHMLFEVWNRDADRGEIAHAVSRDALRWEYSGVVLREPFHLSYPHFFRWRGETFMTPETLEAGCIRLYRARRFPAEWECVAELVDGVAADPTPFRCDGRWWLFACTPPSANDTLRLYHSRRLTGPWREHPASPIVSGDARRARPAGRVGSWNGSLMRVAQDCYPVYGTRVRAFRITELSPTSYREEEAAESPVLSPGDGGWSGRCMHHLDAHPLPDGRWVACVDGRPHREPETAAASPQPRALP
jgi:hypothetical protein